MRGVYPSGCCLVNPPRTLCPYLALLCNSHNGSRLPLLLLTEILRMYIRTDVHSLFIGFMDSVRSCLSYTRKPGDKNSAMESAGIWEFGITHPLTVRLLPGTPAPPKLRWRHLQLGVLRTLRLLPLLLTQHLVPRLPSLTEPDLPQIPNRITVSHKEQPALHQPVEYLDQVAGYRPPLIEVHPG